MHLLVRETRTLDEDGLAVDLGHRPADIVVLSFSDSDLGAAAAAWEATGRPSLRLANLARLRHPMSVDLYVESVIAHARCVVVRLLGGLDYWRYGAEEFFAICRRRAIPLAIVPGDVRDDPRLAGLSTVDAGTLARFDEYWAQGGPANVASALRLAARCAGLTGPDPMPPRPMPAAGEHALSVPVDGAHGTAALVFYRSQLLAGDIAPITAMAEALHARGLGVRALFVSSLKDPAAASFVAEQLAGWRPAVVVNATGFSARQGGQSPLEAAGAPVLQLVLANAAREAWVASSRGLSQTDLAMQVVLPELDGRLLTGAISFKSDTAAVDGLDFARTVNRPDPHGVGLAADRAVGWARLAGTPPAERRVALVLSNYPGGQIGHAVGLDTFASTDAILTLLRDAGYSLGAETPSRTLLRSAPAATLRLDVYREMFGKLPEPTQTAVTEAWGDPADDPHVAEGAFVLRHFWCGNMLVAVQPERGHVLDRKAGYHDPDVPPRHSFMAFYLWLRGRGVHAMVHLGTHGTLEWLPGKAVALSETCFPSVLIAGLPVVYPFIVNNPGEAAAAKRRLGAVTIGHLTPPLHQPVHYGPARELERLIDEYAAADGLDRRRTITLKKQILTLADEAGLLAESGVAPGTPEDESLAHLDAYLCDLKNLQIRDGLHVFGQKLSAERWAATVAALTAANPGAEVCTALAASPAAEAAALLAALNGRFVAPGPAGAPTRGRADVLPTGRNLYTVDPRAVPTRSAVALAERAAADLLRLHRQDFGDWPRAMVIDLWGSTTMRTGGEDFALALVLIGARPVWDDGSARVSGFETLPIALLDRPRVDVTLRISGLFRDAFETQIAMFDSAVRAVAARDEDSFWNPLGEAARGLDGAALRQETCRVFGAAPGAYGSGVGGLLERGAWQGRADLGDAYLAASGHAYGQGVEGAAEQAAFARRVAAADMFVHAQDHREMDLLEGVEHAAHLGGFAAAANRLGGAPALYHLDTSKPEAPRVRSVAEEITRVVRGRAANPHWIGGMMRHGTRGAAEISRAVMGLHGFAATLSTRFDRQFDLLFDATLGDGPVDAFLREENPEARAAMAALFRDAQARGLWQPHRNDLAA